MKPASEKQQQPISGIEHSESSNITGSNLVQSSSGLKKTSSKIPSLFASPLYLLLLIVRILALILMPGFVDKSEFYSPSHLHLAESLLNSIPSASESVVTSTSLMSSSVSSYLTVAAPYAFIKALIPPCIDVVSCAFRSRMALILPRLFLLPLSIIADALMFHCFRFVKYDGARAFSVLFAASWPALTVFSRPGTAALENVCLSLLCFSMVGMKRRSHEITRMILASMAITIGIHVAPEFAVYTLLLFSFLLTVVFRPDASLGRWFTGVCLGLLTCVVISLKISVLDSLHFGFLQLSHESKVLKNLPEILQYVIDFMQQGSDASALFKGWKVEKFALGSIVVNIFREIVFNFSSVRKAIEIAPEAFIVFAPLAMGPLLIGVLSELYFSIMEGVKEVRQELKKIGRDDNTPGAGARRKRKATAAANRKGKSAAKEEDQFTFQDMFQTLLLIGVSTEFMLGGLTGTRFHKIVPTVAAACVVALPRLKVSRWLTLSVWLYMIAAAVFSGVVYNAGSVGSALQLSGVGTSLNVSEPAVNSHLIFYRSLPPPSSLLHFSESETHPQLSHFLPANESVMIESIHEWLNRDEAVYIASTPGLKLGDDNVLDLPLVLTPIGKITPHLGSGFVPLGLDEMVRESSLISYRVDQRWESPTKSSNTDDASTPQNEKSDL